MIPENKPRKPNHSVIPIRLETIRNLDFTKLPETEADFNAFWGVMQFDSYEDYVQDFFAHGYPIENLKPRSFFS